MPHRPHRRSLIADRLQQMVCLPLFSIWLSINRSFHYFTLSWITLFYLNNTVFIDTLCNTTFITFLFFFPVPYRMRQIQVVVGVARARLLPDPHPPGLCPEEAHSVGASGAPVVKLPAVTLQPPRADRLSSRSRIRLSSALSTCSPCLSEFHTGWLWPPSNLFF